MRIERFGSYTFVRVDPSEQFDPLPATSGLVQAGDTYIDAYGSGSAPQQPATLSARYEVHAATPALLDTALDELRALVRTRAQLYARMADGNVRWVYARCLGVRYTRTKANLYYQPVEVLFQPLPGPWNGEPHMGSVTAGSGWVSDAMLLLGVDDYDPGVGSGNLINNGNVDNTSSVWTVTAGSAGITGVTINNTTAGRQWSYSGTIAAGKSLVVDCGARTVLNDGADDYAHFTAPTNGAEWMILEPGPNEITATITSGGTGWTVAPTYYSTWA